MLRRLLFLGEYKRRRLVVLNVAEEGLAAKGAVGEGGEGGAALRLLTTTATTIGPHHNERVGTVRHKRGSGRVQGAGRGGVGGEDNDEGAADGDVAPNLEAASHRAGVEDHKSIAHGRPRWIGRLNGEEKHSHVVEGDGQRRGAGEDAFASFGPERPHAAAVVRGALLIAAVALEHFFRAANAHRNRALDAVPLNIED